MLLAAITLAVLSSAGALEPSKPEPSNAAQQVPPGPAMVPPASAAAAPEAAVSAVARPSKTEVALGEEFELEVVVKGPQGTTWTFPAEALGDEAELRSLSRAASPGAWPPDTHRYVGAIYALGEVELPPLVVGYRLPDSSTGELAVPTAKMRGLSVLPKSGEEQKLSDVRPPVSLGIGRAFWVTLALLLLLVGLVAFLVWRKIRKARPEPEVAPLPLVEPDVEALGALDRLASQALASKGDLRGHYIALTAIAKRYLERRLGAPILEMTTAETLAFLRDQTEGREAHSVMRDVSGAADSIKFARGTAAVEEASRHLDAVRGMVRDTEERRSAALAAVAPSSGPPPQMGQGSSPVGRSLERESGRHTPAASAGTEPPPSGGTA